MTKIIFCVYKEDYYYKNFDRADLALDPKLTKLTVSFSDSIFSPSHPKVRIKDLMNTSINRKMVFTSKDSAYFRFQNDILKEYSIPGELHLEILKTRKTHPLFNTNTISIPIFSLNQEYAYVEVVHSGNGLGGGGYYTLLKKIDGKWKVIDQVGLWDS